MSSSDEKNVDPVGQPVQGKQPTQKPEGQKTSGEQKKNDEGEQQEIRDTGAFRGQNPGRPVILNPDLAGNTDQQAVVEGRVFEKDDEGEKDNRSAEERQEEADKIAQEIWEEQNPPSDK